MSLLAKFTKLVEQMEKGSCPPAYPDRNTAFKGFVDEICSAPWQTAAEREKAQGLIARLLRLKWAEQKASSPPTSSE